MVELNTVEWLNELPEFVRLLPTEELEATALNIVAGTTDFWVAVSDAIRVELGRRCCLFRIVN
jgi:hypothetical protein